MKKSIIPERWKLCPIGGLFGFFLFALILTSNRLKVDELFVARTATVTTSSIHQPVDQIADRPITDTSNLSTIEQNQFNSTSAIESKETDTTPISTTTTPTGVTDLSDINRNQYNSTSTIESDESLITPTTNSTELKAPVISPPSPVVVITKGSIASFPILPPLASNSTGQSEIHGDVTVTAVDEEKEKKKPCDIFDGRWVYKSSYRPEYGVDCPFQSVSSNCQRNGRPDSEYQKWIWQPNDCDIPLFNGTDMLERLRGKKVILVGDSINHNQWQSLACLIYNSISHSRRQRFVKFSSTRFLKVEDYDFTLEFHQSPFLVHLEEKHPSGRRVLHLDKIDPTSKLWRGADVMLFNSAHWWGHGPDIRVWDVFEHKGQLVDNMTKEEAYGHALTTWSNWVTKKINPNKTSVLFRSDSPQHGGHLQCFNATEPVPDDAFMRYYPRSMVEVSEQSMADLSRRFPVKYLNITWLSGYRRDAHPSLYVQEEKKWKAILDEVQSLEQVAKRKGDCSHWCLPGLPDTWNRLLYASLFFVG